MKFRNILLGIVAMGLASSAFAGEDKKVKMKIAVVGDDGAGAQQFKIDSDDIGFDLQDMQIGESRSIVDETGQPILITRTDDGYSFNINGETIDLPDFQDEAGHGMVWVGDGADIDVQVMHDAEVTTMHEMDSTMIITGEPIDATTQQAVRDLLGAAGYDSEVKFIDRDVAHGRKIVIKKVQTVVESPQT
ncbi:MAG: hypothetical protein ACR2QT_07215 [Woeseiaceae bacterium]